jgi:hypothetical protein
MNPLPATSILSFDDKKDPLKNPQLGLLRMRVLSLEIWKARQKLLNKKDLGRDENLRLHGFIAEREEVLRQLRQAYKPILVEDPWQGTSLT